MKKLKQIMITIALTFFVSNGIFAQTTQASISGVVFGSNSAPIKDAIIKIHNESTGFKVSSLSNFKGVFTFKEAFTTYFIFAVIGVLIGAIFNILLFNVIDPSASDTVKELTIKSVVETMQKYNTPASTINEMIAKMKENNPYSTIEILKGSAFVIVFYSILGLIMAAFFKSKTQE